VTLALYRKKGAWADWAIRLRTGSIYSHCELLHKGLAYSSSVRDKGVRVKVLDFPREGWDLIALPNADPVWLLDFFEATKGQGYDWRGIILGHALGLRINEDDKWFCSEWCAAALGLDIPNRHSPGSLAKHILSAGLMQS